MGLADELGRNTGSNSPTTGQNTQSYKIGSLSAQLGREKSAITSPNKANPTIAPGTNFFNDFLARREENAAAKPTAEDTAIENAKAISSEKKMAVEGEERAKLESQKADYQRQLDTLNNTPLNPLFDKNEAQIERDMQTTELQAKIDSIDEQLNKEYSRGEATLNAWAAGTKGAYQTALATLYDFAKRNEERIVRDVEYTGIGNEAPEGEDWGVLDTDNKALERSFDWLSGYKDIGVANVQKAAQQKAEAKEGASAAEKFMLDALSTALDIGADTALSLATFGGAGAASMAARVFGNTAAESAAQGDDLDTQVAKGTVAALIEAASEKIGDGFELAYGGSFGKLFGKQAQEAATKVVNANSKAIKAFLKTSAGESFEEVVSDIANIVADRLFGWNDGEGNVLTDIIDQKNDILYDALLGGFMGAIGGVGTAQNAYNAATMQNAIANGVDAAIQANVESNSGVETTPEGTQNAEVQKNTAPNGTERRPMSMEDYADSNSPVWNNLAYDDTASQQKAMKEAHDRMVTEGKVVEVPESTMQKTAESFPDLRGMKKAERTPILKQKMSELKTSLRQFLSGIKGSNFEFEVNGNVLEAKLYDTGIKEVLEKITQDKANMLSQSDQIFKNAEYLYSLPDYDGDPNIYRWNYFYTPVKIGDSTVGVRIAVRDMATPNESQIYNWGIKKAPTLDGGSPEQSSLSPNVSSVGGIDASLDGARRLPNGSIPGDVSSDASSGNTGTVLNMEKTSPQVTPEAPQRANASDSSIPTPRQNVNSGQTENSGNVGQVRKSPADMLMEAALPVSSNNAPVTNAVSGDVNSQPVHQNAPQSATELLKSYVGANNQSNVGTDRFGFTGERVSTQDVIRDRAYSAEQKAEMGLSDSDTAHIRHADTEVISRARERIAANESQALNEILNKGTEEWTDVDSATSKLLTDKYDAEAKAATERGDNEAATTANKKVAEITLARESKVSEAGRVLRQQSILSTPERIKSDAAVTLYGDNKPTEDGKTPAKLMDIPDSKKNEIMSNVRLYADTLSDVAQGDTASLVSLINSVAKVRRTTGLFSNETSKAFNNALDRIAESSDGEAFLRQVAEAQIKNIASDYVKPSRSEQMKAWRFLAVLSSPKTANTNVSSNFVLGSVLETVSNNAALLPDTIASWFTKTREVGVDKSVFNSAYWQGLTDAALKSYVQVYLDAEIGDGASSYLENTGRTFKAVGNPLERVFSILQRNQSFLLTTTDEAAKGATRAQSKQALSTLAEKGKAKAENIDALAERDALYRVLQLDNKVTEATLGVRKAFDKIGGKIGGLGSNVMMFARIPANAVTTTVDYIPTAGIFKGLYQSVILAHDIRNNTVKPGQQAAAAKSFGRAATGSSLVLASMLLAAKGIIRDYDDKDEDKDIVSQNKTEGKSGTQINMSAFGRMISGKGTTEQDGDLWLNLGWMPILNGLATLGEDLYDTYGDDFKIWNVLDKEANFDAVASAFIDFPAVSTISSIVNAFKYSDKENGFGKAGDAAISGAYQIGQSYLIPNILKQFASGTDSKERDFRSDTQSEQYWNNLKGGIPITRETLPVKLDNYGNEVKNMGGVLNFLNKTFIPGGFVRHNTSEVSDILTKYAETSGDTSLIPSRHAPYKYTFKDETGNKIEYKLSVADKRAYEELRGGIIESFILSATGNNYFKDLPEKTQIEIIKNIESFANKQAETQLEMQLGYDLSTDKEKTVAGLSNIPLFYITNEAFSTLGGKEPQYSTVDSIISNFDRLPQDIQDILYSSVNNLATMRYASDVKGVGSKRFYEIKTETTKLAKEMFNGSTSSAIEAVAIAKGISGTAADKIVALELVNLPDKESGKRASIVRRIEAANEEDISFDEWVGLEAKVWDNIKERGGTSASKKDVYSAAQELGMNDYLCYRIWNKYSTDENVVSVYDDYFSKDYVGFDYPSLYDVYTNTPSTGADLLLSGAQSARNTHTTPTSSAPMFGTQSNPLLDWLNTAVR